MGKKSIFNCVIEGMFLDVIPTGVSKDCKLQIILKKYFSTR